MDAVQTVLWSPPTPPEQVHPTVLWHVWTRLSTDRPALNECSFSSIQYQRYWITHYTYVGIFESSRKVRIRIIYHSKQIQPEHGGEQADAGRDYQTRLAFQILRRERGQGNINFSCWAGHGQSGNLTRSIHTTLVICGTIHTVSTEFNSPFVRLNSLLSVFCFSLYSPKSPNRRRSIEIVKSICQVASSGTWILEWRHRYG